MIRINIISVFILTLQQMFVSDRKATLVMGII